MKPVTKYINDTISSASHKVDSLIEKNVKEKPVLQGNYESRGKR